MDIVRNRPHSRGEGPEAPTVREREPHASIHPWYVVFILVFLVITGIMLGAFRTEEQIARLLSPMSLVLLALASYRLGRILALDDVTEPLRKPFFEIREVDGEREEVPIRHGFRGAIAALLSCPDCTGYWMAALLVYANLLWPAPACVVTLVFAVNGLGHLFNGTIMFLTRRGAAGE
jgi:hypothetical protein